jgi:hypothetical protein
MLAQMSGLRSPIREGFRYLFGGLSILVATVSIVTTIEVTLAPAWSGAVPAPTINRASKGDRLPAAAAFQNELPDGCEALASPLARSALSRIAARCLS